MLNEQHGEQMYVDIISGADEASSGHLRLNAHIARAARETETVVTKLFNGINSGRSSMVIEHQNNEFMTKMFRNLPPFLSFLKGDLAPKIHRLHEVYEKHSFDSPLNFIMVKQDFKRFYEDFMEARLSLLYALELHKDTMFFIDVDEGRLRLQRSLELCSLMYANFEKETNEMSELLDEYHHLVEHDNFDCKGHFAGDQIVWKCTFKKYGFSLLMFVLLSGYASYQIQETVRSSK